MCRWLLRSILMASVLEAAWLEAASRVVDLNGGGDYTDIQAAIDAEADGDTVLVNPGENIIGELIKFSRRRIAHDSLTPEKTDVTNEYGSPIIISLSICFLCFSLPIGATIALPVGSCKMALTGRDLPFAAVPDHERRR